MRRSRRKQGVDVSPIAEEPLLPRAAFAAATSPPEALPTVEPTVEARPAIAMIEEPVLVPEGQSELETPAPVIRSIGTARRRRVVAPRLAGRRTVASAGAFGIALTAVLGSSVGMAAAATPTAAATSSSKAPTGNCDSSGSGEASLANVSPAPSYNLTTSPIYDPTAPLVNEGDHLSLTYSDESGFNATGTVTGPWPGPPSSTALFPDTSNVIAGFTVTPTTHAGSKPPAPPIPITATVPQVSSHGPGFYAVTISTADMDDRIPLPCKVQWLLNVPPPGTPTLAGVVLQCPASGGLPANPQQVPGATLSSSLASPPSTSGPGGGSSFGPSNLPAAGGWTVQANAPSGWTMLTGCPGAAADTPSNRTAATLVSGSTQSATELVTVPSPSGAGTATFFARQNQNNISPTLSIQKSADVSQVTAGNSFNYTLVVTNNGPGAANGVSVNDTVPAGLTINSVSTGCTFSGRAVTCANLGNLTNVGDHLSVTINVKADGTVCGPVVNTGTASASNAAQVNSNPVTVTINCPNFNINLQKSASIGNNATITAGTSFTYTLVATNTGGAAADGVVVTDAIPSQLTINGTPTSTQGTGCSVSSNTVTCNVGTLAANNGSATITINVGTSTSSCGVVNNMGQVTASGGTTGNSNTVTTTITCAENVGITVGVVKTNNAQDPTGTDYGKTETAQALGETFNYQAVITNTSTVTEIIGSVTDSIPGQPNQDVCANLIGQPLAPQASVTCTFQGVAPNTSGASITDTVTVGVSQQGTPTNTATATDNSTVLTNPAVIITKANNADGSGFKNSETVAAGATSVPYQVTVTNPNSAPGTITTLTDTIDGTVTNICPDLINTVLAPSGQPNDSVVCNFTTSVPTSTTVDTAGVTLSVNGVLVSGTAQSTVFPPVLGTTIAPATPAPATLAFTGAPIGKLLASALGMIAMGLLLLFGMQVIDARRRPRLRFAVAERGRRAGPVPPVPNREPPAWKADNGFAWKGGDGSVWKGGNGYEQTATAAAVTWLADRVRGGFWHLRR